MEHRCAICGNIITSIESIQRGMGAECYSALLNAKYKKIMADTELKKQYYVIEAKLIISALNGKKFRNHFKKSFRETLNKQATWLSHRQEVIALDLLGNPRNLIEQMNAEKNYFVSKIEVTPAEIEIARKELRAK
jgi:hypothetical protein